MSVLKSLAATAASITMLAMAGQAAAAPAAAFECPATLAQAEGLLSRLSPLGAETTDEYGTRNRVYDSQGQTVYGLSLFKLEVIRDSDARYNYVAFQAKTNEPFETAKAATFRVTGKKACESDEDATQICKLMGPDYGDVTVMRYIEKSRVGGVNVGCQYARPKG